VVSATDPHGRILGFLDCKKILYVYSIDNKGKEVLYTTPAASLIMSISSKEDTSCIQGATSADVCGNSRNLSKYDIYFSILSKFVLTNWREKY
jgi:hypothetical protein